MNESRSLIRNSARSSDRLWLACRISTRNNQHMVERRTAAAGAVGPRHSPLQIRPEKLKIHQTIQPLERVALRRKLLQTLLNIEEPGLTPHPTPPFAISSTESRSRGARQEVFGGVQLGRAHCDHSQVSSSLKRTGIIPRVSRLSPASLVITDSR